MRPSRIAVRSTDAGERSPGRSRSSFEREYRRLERLCDSLREGAEEAQVAQAELLKTISHDLRNPLSVILVSTRMLARTLAPGEPSRRHVDAIARAAEELNHMLQDFSDAGRIDAGRLIVDRDPQEVKPLLEQALSAVRSIAEPKGVHLSFEIDEDAPAVLGDRDRLIKVLSSFLANALKFTPKNGAITLRVEPEEDAALFSITDTGPGIPGDQQAMVFTRPVGSRQAVVQGAGIALYVSKGIIEAHGGRAWVESEVGRGTTIFFTIPAHVEEEAEAEAEAEAPIN